MSNVYDDKYLSYRAFDSDSTVYRLDVSGVSASISLPPGGYYVHLVGSTGADHALLRHGAAAAIPASGASGAGYILAVGSAITMRLTATTTMHAITDAGTARLYFVKVT